MYKKIFVVMILALFLIVSIAAISAQDSIPVKAVWEGDVGDIITVNLLRDGNVVDTVNLTSANSWKTAFDVDGDDGSYNVSVVESKDISSSVNGTADTGFVVSCSLTRDVLKASDEYSSVEGASQDDNSSEDANEILGATDAVNGTANNNTNSNTTSTSNTTTEDSNTAGSDKTNDEKDDSTSKQKTITTTKTTKTTKIVSKEAKKDKKPDNKTKTKMDNTGFPIIVLVIAVFVAILVPLSRKK